MTDSTAAKGACGEERAKHPGQVAVTLVPSGYDRPTDIQVAVDASLRSLDLPNNFIRPGERVVLQPNWVKEDDERRPGPDAWEHLVTHPAVVEAAARWAAASLRGSGFETDREAMPV